MNQLIRENYFIFVKLSIIGCMIAYVACEHKESFQVESLGWFFCAVFTFAAIMLELMETKRWKWVMLVIELLVVLVLIFQLNENPEVLFFACIGWLDAVVLCRLSPWTGSMSYVVLYAYHGNVFFGFMIITLMLCVYFQHVQIIQKERSDFRRMIEKEFALKEHMDEQKKKFYEELSRSNLKMENRMLEEKNQIYQQLHDKLGHSINGSVYQLEAAKIVMKSKPEEGEQILQRVIDQLRTSMDEIRMIFRKQRPGKQQMTLLRFHQLCEECREKYHIDATFDIEGEEREIPEKILETVLDNTYEAVSNALKYANCTKITIRMVRMNQRLRCTIEDNGKGCDKVQQGMGLQGMYSRVRELEGIMNVDGSHGFVITMIFPLKDK